MLIQRDFAISKQYIKVVTFQAKKHAIVTWRNLLKEKLAEIMMEEDIAAGTEGKLPRNA